MNDNKVVSKLLFFSTYIVNKALKTFRFCALYYFLTLYSYYSYSLLYICIINFII